MVELTVEIPEGIEVNVENRTIIVKGPKGELKKNYPKEFILIKKKDNIITISGEGSKSKAMAGTFKSHILNMIKGVQEEYVYKLKICFNHFPFTAEKKDDKIIIKNFLGEKTPREFEIPKGVEVKIEKTNITIISLDKELAGQSASNFEIATKVKNRDRRVFQDGIFITSKAGREI